MEYLKIIKNNEKYDTWKDSEEAGYPHVVMYEDGHPEVSAKTVIYNNHTERPSMLIQFTIEDTFSPMVSAPEKTYTAEEGMTFADFCDSEYNIDGWFVTEHNGGNVIKHQYNFYIYDGTGSPIDASVIIENNGIYRWGD